MYKRVLIKFSGEMLAGENKKGIDLKVLKNYAQEIKEVYDLGVKIVIVVGGGNFVRGRELIDISRATADYMGMLATVINSLAFQEVLEGLGVPTRVMTALEIRSVAEPFIVIKEGSGYYFLSRPRRFGKSLLISTIEYLFKGEKELYKGLYIYSYNIGNKSLVIEDKWNWEEIYPVIRIDFGDTQVRSEEELEKELKAIIIETGKVYSYKYNKNIQ